MDSATNLKSFSYGTVDFLEDDVNFGWENLMEVSFAFSPRVRAGHTVYHQMQHLPSAKTSPLVHWALKSAFDRNWMVFKQ